jgi:hypothetical protein
MNRQNQIVPLADHDDPTQREADAAAVFEHLVSGKPLDPAVVARVRARAEQIRTDNFKQHGIVDDETFQSLLDDEA